MAHFGQIHVLNSCEFITRSHHACKETNSPPELLFCPASNFFSVLTIFSLHIKFFDLGSYNMKHGFPFLRFGALREDNTFRNGLFFLFK